MDGEWTRYGNAVGEVFVVLCARIVCMYPLLLAAVFRETGNINLARVHGWIRWPLPIQYIPVEPHRSDLYWSSIPITGRASVRASFLEAVTEAVVSCFVIELMLYVLGSWGGIDVIRDLETD